MVEGSVGLPAARNASASLARAFKSALSGSMVSANLILACVYSWPQWNAMSSGSARSFNSECHICGMVPSITRPQPTENNVSATKAIFSESKM